MESTSWEESSYQVKTILTMFSVLISKKSFNLCEKHQVVHCRMPHDRRSSSSHTAEQGPAIYPGFCRLSFVFVFVFVFVHLSLSFASAIVSDVFVCLLPPCCLQNNTYVVCRLFIFKRNQTNLMQRDFRFQMDASQKFWAGNHSMNYR